MLEATVEVKAEEIEVHHQEDRIARRHQENVKIHQEKKIDTEMNEDVIEIMMTGEGLEVLPIVIENVKEKGNQRTKDEMNDHDETIMKNEKRERMVKNESVCLFHPNTTSTDISKQPSHHRLQQLMMNSIQLNRTLRSSSFDYR